MKSCLPCLLLLSLTLSGCAQSSRDQMIGRWRNARMSIVLEDSGKFWYRNRTTRYQGIWNLDATQSPTLLSFEMVEDGIPNAPVIKGYFHAELLTEERLKLTRFEPDKDAPEADELPSESFVLKKGEQKRSQPGRAARL